MKIVIIGGKGTAIVVAEQIHDAHVRYGMDCEVIGLALDDHSMGDEINGFPILCDIHNAFQKFSEIKDVYFIYQLYRPDIIHERTQLLLDLNIPLEKFANFVHPTVMLAKSAKIGRGNVILANCVINPNVKIGNFNTFNSCTLIGHDTIIGNNNFFAAHACVGSALTIDNENFIGLNATLRNGIHVYNNTIIGISSVVTKDCSNSGIYYGNPATNKNKLNHPIR